MASVKILVGGDPGSIHTSCFTSLLQEMGYDVCIFQSEYLMDKMSTSRIRLSMSYSRFLRGRMAISSWSLCAVKLALSAVIKNQVYEQTVFPAMGSRRKCDTEITSTASGVADIELET